MILDFYNEAGQLAISYKIYRAWVSEYQAMPDLDANANAVAIQRLKLENEGWDRDVSRDRADRAQLHLDPRLEDRRDCAARRRAAAQSLGGGRGRSPSCAGRWRCSRSRCPNASRRVSSRAAGHERNRLLLRLHELSFGPELTAVASCSDCDGAAGVLGAGGRAGRADRGRLEPRGRSSGTSGSSDTGCVPVTTADLLATLAVARARGAPQELLLSRCLVAEPAPESALSRVPTVIEQFERAARRDRAQLQRRLPRVRRTRRWSTSTSRASSGPRCGGSGTRLLREIHALAAGYGWSEPAILAMGARRRAAYLELVGRERAARADGDARAGSAVVGGAARAAAVCARPPQPGQAGEAGACRQLAVVGPAERPGGEPQRGTVSDDRPAGGRARPAVADVTRSSDRPDRAQRPGSDRVSVAADGLTAPPAGVTPRHRPLGGVAL